MPIWVRKGLYEFTGADELVVKSLARYFGISYGDMVQRIKTPHPKEKPTKESKKKNEQLPVS